MPDTKQLWEKALLDIEPNISKANFNTWFRNTFIAKQDAGDIYISVPNNFVRDWLESKYHKLIIKALRELEPGVRAVEYVITKVEDRARPRPIQETLRQQFGPDLGLAGLYIDRENNLNPKYTFETLIVGPFNEMAHAAAQAVIKSPGTAYNPLFIYGGTGLGKTHLIQAAGNQIRQHNNSRKIYYLNCEQFVTDVVNMIQSNRGNLLKEKYRKYDVLIIDDVQFIAGKDKSQEELFHLFNYMHENNKQIIFSSDKPPKFIPNLEERLRSRFEGGMIVDISKPDPESRTAILRQKIKIAQIVLEDEIVNYLAQMVTESIRELEGALNTIIVQSQAKQRSLALNEVKSLIKNNIRPQKTISVKEVMKIIAEFYNIEERFLYEKTRRKEVVKPRQVIMYILRQDFNTSYPYIGQKLGGRDHTTVIHACNKIIDDIKTDSLLVQELEQIRTLLYAT